MAESRHVTHGETGAEEREAEREQLLAFRLGRLLVLLGVDHRQTSAGQVEAGRTVAHVCTSRGTKKSRHSTTNRSAVSTRWRHFATSKRRQPIAGKMSKFHQTSSAGSRSGGRKRATHNRSERTQQNSKVGRSFNSQNDEKILPLPFHQQKSTQLTAPSDRRVTHCSHLNLTARYGRELWQRRTER